MYARLFRSEFPSANQSALENKKIPGRSEPSEDRLSPEDNIDVITKAALSQESGDDFMPENEKPGYWAVLPASVRYDEQISPNAKLLYAEISSLTGSSGYCFAKNEYFMQNFGFSVRTISRLITELENAGFIRIENAQSCQRKIYAGINPLAGVPPSREDLDENIDKNVHVTSPKLSMYIDKIVQVPINNDINNKNNKKSASVPEWKPERFERLWRFYPHEFRGGKQKAVKAWEKLRPDDDTLRLMAYGMQLDMETELWQRGIGIPNLSTYLNQERWKDAIERAQDQGEEDETGGAYAPDEERVIYV